MSSDLCFLLTLIASAISISRRMASGRLGLSGSFEAQASSRSLQIRIKSQAELVYQSRCEDGPGLVFSLTSPIDFDGIAYYLLSGNSEPSKRLTLLPGSNPSQGDDPWPRLITSLTQFAR